MKNNTMRQTMIDAINDYYDRLESNDNPKTYIPATPENYEFIKELSIPKSGRNLEEMVRVLHDDVFPYRIDGEHPRSLAFVPSPVSDVSKLGDIITTLYNPNAAGWFSAPIVAQIHQELIRWFCDRVGYGESSGGVFVSGGSLANLTCIIAARNDKLPIDEIHKGVAYVSEQAHHSVNKALRMIGIPDSRIRKVDTDEDMRMIPESLDALVQEDKKSGLIPFVLIATAGTTNAGTIDPLEALSGICRDHNLWFHVDGAFGASILASDTNKHLLKGVEEADSIIWDAHKWLYQTYTCAVALVKNQQTLLNSFSDNPSYLKDAASGQVQSWDLGPELSRSALGVKLWLTMQVLGTDTFAKNIDYSVGMAKKMESIVLNTKNWEIVTHASLGMLTFAYRDSRFTDEQMDKFHSSICNSITNDGIATVLTTEIHGRKVVRICTISPDVTVEDLELTMTELNKRMQALVG